MCVGAWMRPLVRAWGAATQYWRVFELIDISIYLSIYAVELKTGPREALYVLKLVQVFVSQISFSLQKEEENKKNKQYQKNVKTGPILWRNIFGPMFNTTLDQFLT